VLREGGKSEHSERCDKLFFSKSLYNLETRIASEVVVVKKNKKNDKFMNCKCISIKIIVFILVIVVVLILASSIGSNCKKANNNIVFSIDKDGNVYDGNHKYLGKLGDENVTFYDENGNFIGSATFNIK
jgi:hypothetical protein